MVDSARFAPPAPRFTKKRTLEVLDARASKIASEQAFDRSGGTRQLYGLKFDDVLLAQIDRAVAYGRMRAFEDFACAVEENHRFEAPAPGGS